MNRDNKLKEIDIENHILYYLDDISNNNDLILDNVLFLIMLFLHATL